MRRYNAAGVPQGDDVRVGPADFQAFPQVALQRSGESFVLAREFFVSCGDGNDIHARRFNRAGVPEGEIFVPGSAAGWQARPGISMDGGGRFVIAWVGGGPLDTQDVFALRFAPSTDFTPPTVAEASFDYRSAPHKLVYRFSEDVSASLSREDIEVRTVPGGEFSNPATYAYDPATNTATFTFSGLLPNGNYRAILSRAGVQDTSANALAADSVLDFYVLAGDVDRNRVVNSQDFTTLASNFGRTGRTWAQGDLDGNGVVNSSDFVILASNFARSVPAPAAPAAVAPPSAAVAQAAPAAAKPAKAAKAKARSLTRVSLRAVPKPR